MKSCIPAVCIDTDIRLFKKELEKGFTHPDATSNGLELVDCSEKVPDDYEGLFLERKTYFFTFKS